MSLNLTFTNEGFNNIVLRNENNFVLLRTNVFHDDEAWLWKEVFTKLNNISFNAEKLYHGVTYTFHEKFICLHGDKRHKGVKKTYTGCNVKMFIKIKLITKATCKTDKDVRKHPCIVRIEGVHNHPTEAASALQELRIPTETIDTFNKYFDLGMTAPQAMRFHNEKLNFYLSDLANAAVNPKSRSVYYMREKWLKNNHGNLGGGDMFSAIKKYADENPLSKIEYEQTGDRFTVVLVTEFMLNIHQEFREAGEVVFVDTTSHLDQLNTAVTPLLCAGPAGALPLGVIFTSSQDEASYTAGFDMLKRVLGESAFYKKGHPLCFITDNSDAERNALRTVWPISERYLCVFHILQQLWRWLCDSSHRVKKEHRQILMHLVKKLVYAESEQKFNEDWHAFLQTPEAQCYNNFIRFQHSRSAQKRGI